MNGIVSPVTDEKSEVVSTIGIGHSMQMQETLYDATKTIAASSEEISASSQVLSVNA